MNALAGDIKQLVGALVAAGAGRDPVFVCNPVQAATLKLLASPLFTYPVLQSSALALGTVVCVEASSFVSAFDPVPEFRAGEEMTVHMEDTAPVDPIMGGTPVRSMFQVDSIALAMTLRTAWGLRTASVAGKANIAFLNGATW
jgi:hypothetical protein